MELRSIKGELFNKLDQHVDVEDDHVFPLIKSTTLFHGLKQRSDARVIVTQTKIGEDTSILRSKAPRLWTYLSHHRDVFARRRSSIYTGGPPYAMFGVGEYSFASYKVGVSGLHKEARFRTIGPIDGRPAMLDDTCYFAACSSLRQAALLASLLNLPQTADLLQALVFWDAKRPITKRVLQQIDVLALLKHAPRDELLSRAAEEFAQWTDVSTDDHGWTRDDLARCLLGVGSRGDSDEQLALAL